MAIQKGIAIYSAHTNLDNAQGGVNYMIAEKLALQDVRFLAPLKGQEGGSGIIGELSEAIPTEAFLTHVKQTFHIECLNSNSTTKQSIKRVALCGGAGDFLLDEAISQQADAFLTGEMSYHRYFGHENDLLIGVMGHYQSEQFTIQLLERILMQAQPDLHIVKTQVNTNPIKSLISL